MKRALYKSPPKDMYNPDVHRDEFHSGKIEVQCSNLGSRRIKVTY